VLEKDVKNQRKNAHLLDQLIIIIKDINMLGLKLTNYVLKENSVHGMKNVLVKNVTNSTQNVDSLVNQFVKQNQRNVNGKYLRMERENNVATQRKHVKTRNVVSQRNVNL